MPKQKVTVKLKRNKLRSFNELVNELKIKIRSLEIGQLRFGSIGDEILVTFSVNEKFRGVVVENLTRQRFDVLFVNEKGSKPQKNLSLTKVMETTKPATWSDLKNLQSPSTKDLPVEKLVKTGEYESVLKIALDHRNSLQKREEAKKNLDAAVNSAINRAYTKALKSKREGDDSLRILLKIGGDTKLKNLHKIDLMKRAGLRAIDLCQSYDNLVGDLITICTDNRLHSLVTIKAAVALSNKIFVNSYRYDEEKELAARNINIRWLHMAFDITMKDVSKDEITSVNRLIKFVEKARAKK